MKKHFILIISLAVLVSLECFSQTELQNFNKYWYYRDRLKKRFMVQGNLPGQSLVYGKIKTKNYSSNPHFDYENGDQTISFGRYLSVLGTKLGLLQQNNQACESTQQELYDAFKAYERLDYSAEQAVEYSRVIS